MQYFGLWTGSMTEQGRVVVKMQHPVGDGVIILSVSMHVAECKTGSHGD